MRQEMVIETVQKRNVLILGTRVRSEYYRAKIVELKRFAKETGGQFFLLRAEREEILAPDIFYGASSGCRVYSKRLSISSLACRPGPSKIRH